MGQRQFCQQPRRTMIGDRDVFAAGFLPERTSQPALADAGRARQQKSLASTYSRHRVASLPPCFTSATLPVLSWLTGSNITGASYVNRSGALRTGGGAWPSPCTCKTHNMKRSWNCQCRRQGVPSCSHSYGGLRSTNGLSKTAFVLPWQAAGTRPLVASQSFRSGRERLLMVESPN